MVCRIGGDEVVVVPGDVEQRKHCCRVGRRSGTGKRQREWASAVERSHLIGHVLRDQLAAFYFQFGDLVADSPDHHRWMVAIAQHHRREILLPPCIEVAGVIEFDLVRLPHVERLVENQQADPVAGIQKCGARRIVRSPHRTVSRRLQQFHSALFGAVECCRTQRPVVVVNAAARQLHRLAVQKQSLFRGPRERSNSEGGFHLVDDFAVFSHLGDGAIHCGRTGRPQIRVR